MVDVIKASSPNLGTGPWRDSVHVLIKIHMIPCLYCEAMAMRNRILTGPLLPCLYQDKKRLVRGRGRGRWLGRGLALNRNRIHSESSECPRDPGLPSLLPPFTLGMKRGISVLQRRAIIIHIGRRPHHRPHRKLSILPRNLFRNAVAKICGACVDPSKYHSAGWGYA